MKNIKSSSVHKHNLHNQNQKYYDKSIHNLQILKQKLKKLLKLSSNNEFIFEMGIFHDKINDWGDHAKVLYRAIKHTHDENVQDMKDTIHQGLQFKIEFLNEFKHYKQKQISFEAFKIKLSSLYQNQDQQEIQQKKIKIPQIIEIESKTPQHTEKQSENHMNQEQFQQFYQSFMERQNLRLKQNPNAEVRGINTEQLKAKLVNTMENSDIHYIFENENLDPVIDTRTWRYKKSDKKCNIFTLYKARAGQFPEKEEHLENMKVIKRLESLKNGQTFKSTKKNIDGYEKDFFVSNDTFNYYQLKQKKNGIKTSQLSTISEFQIQKKETLENMHKEKQKLEQQNQQNNKPQEPVQSNPKQDLQKQLEDKKLVLKMKSVISKMKNFKSIKKTDPSNKGQNNTPEMQSPTSKQLNKSPVLLRHRSLKKQRLTDEQLIHLQEIEQKNKQAPLLNLQKLDTQNQQNNQFEQVEKQQSQQEKKLEQDEPNQQLQQQQKDTNQPSKLYSQIKQQQNQQRNHEYQQQEQQQFVFKNEHYQDFNNNSINKKGDINNNNIKNNKINSSSQVNSEQEQHDSKAKNNSPNYTPSNKTNCTLNLNSNSNDKFGQVQYPLTTPRKVINNFLEQTPNTNPNPNNNTNIFNSSEYYSQQNNSIQIGFNGGEDSNVSFNKNRVNSCANLVSRKSVKECTSVQQLLKKKRGVRHSSQSQACLILPLTSQNSYRKHEPILQSHPVRIDEVSLNDSNIMQSSPKKRRQHTQGSISCTNLGDIEDIFASTGSRKQKYSISKNLILKHVEQNFSSSHSPLKRRTLNKKNESTQMYFNQ